MTRDMMWSLLSTLVSSIFEIVLLHMWATHKVQIYTDFWQYPYWSLLWLCGIPYWRLSHFFCIHRMMHPWRVACVFLSLCSNSLRHVTGLPDVGKLLYRYVHSLHHKSYNPTAWSGISMHPVCHGFFVFFFLKKSCFPF